MPGGSASAVQRVRIFIGTPPGSGGFESHDISVIQRGVRLPSPSIRLARSAAFKHVLQLAQVAHLHVAGKPCLTVGTACRIWVHVENIELHAARTFTRRTQRSIALVQAEQAPGEIEGSYTALCPVRSETRRQDNISWMAGLECRIGLVQDIPVDAGATPSRPSRRTAGRRRAADLARSGSAST